MSLQPTSDQWWKNGVVYCLDVETFLDWRRRRHGRPARPGRADRLPRRHRRHRPLAHALLPDARPRRRLRHHRLLRRRPPPRHARRLRRGRPDRPGPRHAGDRRPGREPHLRPAPVVPGRPVRPGVALPRLVRVGRRAARRPRARPRCSPASRTASGPTTARSAQLLPAPLLPPPARPQRGQPGGAGRDRPDRRVLAAARRERLPGRRRAVPARARRHRRRRAGRPPPVPQGAAGVRPAPPGRRHPARRGQPAAARAARASSATRTATSSTSSSTSRSCSGSTWRSPGSDAGPVEQALADAAGRAVRLAVGDVPAQPRRADARPAHATTSARRCSPPSVPTRRCSSTAAASAGGCRRCWAATATGSSMAYSLLFSLPGTPVLFYGEEIGMGENLDAPGRAAVRTPMQWSDEPGAGFSTGRPDDVRRPAPRRRLRAAGRQRRRPAPRPRLAAQLVRAADPPAPGDARSSGWGTWQVLPNDQPAVLAHRCDWDGSTVVAVHNFSPSRAGSSCRSTASTTPSGSTTCSTGATMRRWTSRCCG